MSGARYECVADASVEHTEAEIESCVECFRCSDCGPSECAACADDRAYLMAKDERE